MPWIRMLAESEVLARNDKLARLYRANFEAGTEQVDNVLKIHSLAPETLDGHLRLYRSVMFSAGATSRRERELLAVAVSAANACRY